MSELLDTISAHELAEWQAFERVNGPIDNLWRDAALAQLVENTHDLMYLTSQAHFTDKTHTAGPIEKRDKPYPRPYEVWASQQGR